MTPLTFGQLREANTARLGPTGWNHPLNGWSRDDWTVAAGGELGEAMNVLKKLNRERDGLIGNDKPASVLRDQFGDEGADFALYVDLFAASEDLVLGPVDSPVSELVLGNGIKPYLSNPPSRHMAVALRCFATATSHLEQAAWWHQQNGECREYWDNREFAADSLVDALTSLAAALRHFGIDLGAAIVRKFNATSEKHGMPHRLVAS